MTAAKAHRPTKTRNATREFFAHRGMANSGVLRYQKSLSANVVYRCHRGHGYDVCAINPHATAVEGCPCWPDLRSVPDGLDAVRARRQAEPQRDSEVLEGRSPGGGPPYVVWRSEDGHIGLLHPEPHAVTGSPRPQTSG